jgi:hypothetical protein
MSWRDRLWEFNQKPFDSEEEFQEQTKIIGGNLGIKSPTSDSVIRISESGQIDLFALSNLGIRIDPKSKSIMFHADKIHFYTNDTNVYTVNPMGFRWNTMSFNPAGLVPSTDVTPTPMLLPPVDMPNRLIDALKDIMKDLTNI